MLHEVRPRCDAAGVLTAVAPASLACALEGWALLVVCHPHRKLPKEAGARAQWSYGCQVQFWTPVVPLLPVREALALSPNLRSETARCSAQSWLISVDTGAGSSGLPAPSVALSTGLLLKLGQMSLARKSILSQQRRAAA